MRDYLYLWHDPERRRLVTSGIEFRDLASGDMIWRWEGGRRLTVRVEAVVATNREAPVFNLVVGESAVFVAGGFLARGKPPIVEIDSSDRSGQ